MARAKKVPFRLRSIAMGLLALLATGLLFMYLVRERKPMEKFVALEASAATPIVLFTEENYGGIGKAIRNSDDLNAYRGWIRSVKVYPGYKLVAQHTCSGGTVKSGEFTASTPSFNLCGWVGMAKNDTSRFSLTTNPAATPEKPIVLFSEANYGGNITYCANNTDLAAVRGWVRSMKILPGKRLYVDNNCNGTQKSKAFTADSPTFDACGWPGLFKTEKTLFELTDDTPSDAFPVIVYSGANYGGRATPVSIISAQSLNTYIWSMKIKQGYYVTLSNHKCLPVPGGCSNSSTIASKYYTANVSNFSPCNEALKCNGATVLPGTFSINQMTAWTSIALYGINTQPDWGVNVLGYLGTTLHYRVSNQNGFMGIYVASYYMGNGNWGNWNPITSGATAIGDVNGHYDDPIIQQLVFNTWNVSIDRLGGYGGAEVHTYTRQSNPELFVNPSVKKVLMQPSLRAPGNGNVVEGGGSYLSGNRNIKVWVELRPETA